MEKEKFTDKDINELSKVIKYEDFKKIALDEGLKIGDWNTKLIALHIFHGVGNHIEKQGKDMFEQMTIVNKAIEDILGLPKEDVAILATESIKYSEIVDDWLVENKYATR